MSDGQFTGKNSVERPQNIQFALLLRRGIAQQKSLNVHISVLLIILLPNGIKGKWFGPIIITPQKRKNEKICPQNTAFPVQLFSASVAISSGHLIGVFFFFFYN
jgi:hypothetical protein